MANVNAASFFNLRNPASPPDGEDGMNFMQAQNASGALPGLAPVPTQGPTTLANPMAMDGFKNPPGPINKTSNTQTQQNVQKLKSMFSQDEWDNLQKQAGSSPVIQDLRKAIEEQDARAKAYEAQVAVKDTNNYSAIGEAADTLNQINGTKSNYGAALAKQAAENDPKKIQDEILKNFSDVTKARGELGKETLSATKDMQNGEISNKYIDAQMAGLNPANQGVIEQRNERMFQSARDKLVNDKQLTALGGYIRSVGNGVNQLGANTLPNTLAELQNIANSVAGAGSGLSAAERTEMGLNNLSTDITKVKNYLSGPQPVTGGLKNPIVQQLIERIKTEHDALSQYYNTRGAAILDNPTLFSKNPAYENSMRNTFAQMQKSVAFTPQAQGIENRNSPSPMGGVPQVKEYSPGMQVNVGDKIKDPKNGSIHTYLGGDINNESAWEESK